MLDRADFFPFFTDDVELTDVRYSKPFIYKYYYFPDPEIRRKFFTTPTLKFAHKDELNDPFELTRRWLNFGSPFNQAAFDKYVRKRVEERISDIKFIRAKIFARLKEEMPTLSRQQARHLIQSRIGPGEIERERKILLSQMAAMEELFPKVFQDQESEFIEDFARTTGILSLTGDPDSRHMWEKYASNGRGFVLELNAEHEFFLNNENTRDSKKLLRKVFYRDDRINDFWENPYYLFLIKELCWALEEEWRVLRALDRCRKIPQSNNQFLYVVDVPPKLISAVTFGRNCSASCVSELEELLLKFDPDIVVRRAHGKI